MNPQFDMARAFREAAAGNEVRELIARTSRGVLKQVDDELSALKNRLVELNDTYSTEYRGIHLRAKVLSELFDQLNRIQETGKQAEVEIEQEQDAQDDEKQGANGNE